VQPPTVRDAAALAAHRLGCEELGALFWALIYIVSGAPSRQTESAETTLCASAARPLRSLHIHEGLFFTVLVYNKTQSVSEGVGRPISRWMDAKSSSLLLIYLVFVEPLDAYFARAVPGRGGEGSGMTTTMASTRVSRAGVRATAPPSVIDRSLLFRDRAGKALPVSRLNWALQDKLLGGIAAVPVGVQLWRQWAAGAAKQVTKMDVLDANFGGGGGGGGGGTVSAPAFAGLPSIGHVDLGSNFGGILEHQSGHSALTAASKYAGDPNLSINRVNTASVFLFRAASMRCHGAMGLHSRHPGGSLGMRHPLEPNPTTPAAAVAAPSPVPPYLQATTPAPSNGGGGGDGGVSTMLGSHRPPPPRPPPPPAAASGPPQHAAQRVSQLQLARTYRVDRSAAEGLADAELRRLYGVNAKYKSVQQQQAVYAVLHARDPQTVLTVLPTGGGKTNVWLLPCAAERHAADAAALASAPAEVGSGNRRDGTTSAAPAAGAAAAGGGAGALASRVPPSRGSGSPLSWGPPVTVVLTPTVAVAANAREAAEAAGLVVAMWPKAAVGRSAALYPTDASVLIVNMCTAVADKVGIAQFFAALDAVGRLARVVIDEAHLVALWSGFLHLLLELRDVLLDLRCPSILLSATVPPTAVTELCAGVGHTISRPFLCIRQSVRRENVAYRVEPCPYVFSRRPRNSVGAGEEDPNAELHRAAAARVVRQVHGMRCANGTIAGRSACVAVCCEMTAEVDGIAAAIGALLELHVSAGMADAAGGGADESVAVAAQASLDVVVVKFHSQLDAAELAPLPPASSLSSRGGGGGGIGGRPGSSSGGGAAAAGADADPLVAQCVRVYAKGQLLCGDDGGADAAASGSRRVGSGASVPAIRSGRPSASAAAVVAAEAAADGVGVTIMVGSPAVTTGSDFPKMTWGLFLGGRNILSFSQAAGRLERDGRGGGGWSEQAIAEVWNPRNFSDALVDRNGTPVVDIAGLGDFDAWVNGTLSSSSSAGGASGGLAQVCRRWGLDSVLDGVPESEFKTCLQAGSAQCDLCMSRAAAAAAAAPAAAATGVAATAFVRRGDVAPVVRPLGAAQSVGGGGVGRARGGHLQQQQLRSRPGGPEPSSVGSSSGFVSEEMPGGYRRVSRRLFGAGDATAGARGVDGAAAAGAGAGSGAPPPARTRPSAADVAIGTRRGSRAGWVLARGYVGSPESSPASGAGSPVSPANANESAAGLHGLALLAAAAPSDEESGSASQRAAADAASPATAAGGGGGRASSAAGGAARSSAASRLAAATLVPDERSLVFTQQMVDVMRSGGRAAVALRERHADDHPLPCAWCCARGLQQPPGEHTTATCFLGTCCSCLKQNGRLCGGPDLQTLSPHTERCHDIWFDCKSRRQAWDTGVQGQRCLGCTLQNFYKPERAAKAVSSHDVVRYGPKACSWLFCIRVTLIQVQLARRRMTQRRPAFGLGLQEACGVAWRTRSASGGAAGRVPPTALLDWGPMQAPASADLVAEWLTSSTQGVPNIALFAPVLADALGVAF